MDVFEDVTADISKAVLASGLVLALPELGSSACGVGPVSALAAFTLQHPSSDKVAPSLVGEGAAVVQHALNKLAQALAVAPMRLNSSMLIRRKVVSHLIYLMGETSIQHNLAAE